MLGLKALHSSDLTYCETAHGFMKQDVGVTWCELYARIYRGCTMPWTSLLLHPWMQLDASAAAVFA